ncbi:aminoglycoside phosphotransferase family protein [Bradyrhizobium sp. SZCCHNR3118]|uniref:phosphotransferase family protein n=1 Tax=Bradyrhizobium sp. SZCCHNR3118 TaxID=3057468 RepID=UPI002916FEB5|nr:aminoglycoside phosphotransferase family protein [Bradyrhizobium sp. SZCCHNR3118]
MGISGLTILPGSTLVSEVILPFLHGHGIEPRRIVEFQLGIASRNYQVTDGCGKALVVRYDERRTLDMMREDRLLSECARKSGVRTPNGPWLEGESTCGTIVARPLIAGVALPDLTPGIWPAATCLGGTLRRIHTAELPNVRRGFFYSGVINRSREMRAKIDAAVNEMADTSDHVRLLREAVNRIDSIGFHQRELNRSPVSMVHGDYTPSNILLSNGDIYVLDWEKACVGPTYSDLAQALFYFCAAIPDGVGSFTSEFISQYEGDCATLGEALRPWMVVYPAAIFLVDAVSAAVNRSRMGAEFNPRREVYFQSMSMQRFRRFIEIEEEMLASIPRTKR